MGSVLALKPNMTGKMLLPGHDHNFPTMYNPSESCFSLSSQKSAASSNTRPAPPSTAAKPVEESKPNMQPSRDNCDRRRPEEEEDSSRLFNMSQQYMNKSVTPFLREHIPGLYAPIGKPDLPSMMNLRTKDPNSKYCYRHRPDSKCRRAADESKMGLIQSELETLPDGDRQAITNVWSLFSAAPTKQRELMLRGVISQCCFPQLSLVSREVHEQLKIDFISALPVELSLKILCYLDCKSLCKTAQVSRRWSILSGDDVVWHRMCEQHIGRKCEKCQWGLPRLEKKRLREWKIQHMPANPSRPIALPPAPAPAPSVSTAVKRFAEESDGELESKRRCTQAASDREASQEPEYKSRYRPWKDVYRDRFKVGSNWKNGRCTIKTFSGHSNGVTCLQFDDNMLATGSYDATIKLWNIEKGEVVRTLAGHTMGIRALQFDDRLLVSGSLDGTVKIWNWRTGACINTLSHQEGVITVHMEGDYVASGSIDQSIKIFNFKTKESFCLRGHGDWVNQVRLDLTSRTLLSASDDCTVKLWDLDSRTCIKTYEGHVGQVQQVLALPEDFEIDDVAPREADTSSTASNRSTTPTDFLSQVSLQQKADEERAAYGPMFVEHPERPLPPRHILTGSLDGTLRVWDTATGKSPRCFWGHVEGVWGLAADTLRYVSGANDATVKVWEPRTGKCERTFTGHSGPVTCVGLSDSRFASGGEDGEVRLYSFEGEPSECQERGTPS
ncbi:quinon protein alcohol dehydrogenase-like superfamily [Xylariaceae sp. FL1272]|nr:quinon protein alcohol dehydrogenase-like superfamily [Xylariaceae sp. FL1272]